MIEHEETGRLATARLIPRQQPIDGEVLVDVLFASSGIEPEIVAAAEPQEVLPGRHYPVARTGHLIALKVLSRDSVRRPQDQADLVALIAAAEAGDLEVARSGCELITARGFNRERELVKDLEELLEILG